MKKIYLLIFAVAPAMAFSQAIPNNVRTQFSMDRLSRMNFNRIENSVIGLEAPPGRVIGDTYLDPKWNMASVIIADKNTLIEGYPMKYDIKAQNIEIKTATGVRLLDVKKVAQLVWLDSLTQQPHYFVNAAKYKDDGVPMIGLMEVLVDGQKSLFKKTRLNVKQPTYVAALDVGSRDTEIQKKSAFYYNNGEEVVEIKSKKKFIEGLGDAGTDIEKHIKDNRVDFKSQSGLMQVFEFYNSKVAAN
jgi:hypothetical protein